MNEIKLAAGKDAQNSEGWACDRRRRIRKTIRTGLFVSVLFRPSAYVPQPFTVIPSSGKMHFVPEWGRFDCGISEQWTSTLSYFEAKGWGRSSLKHAKSLMSGIFTYAKNLGMLDGVNPVEGTIIPRNAAAPAETLASTPDEVVAILDVLKRAKDVEQHLKL